MLYVMHINDTQRYNFIRVDREWIVSKFRSTEWGVDVYFVYWSSLVHIEHDSRFTAENIWLCDFSNATGRVQVG